MLMLGEEAHKTLYLKRYGSDKVYKVKLIPVTVGPYKGKYRVFGYYGRRGSTLKEVEKTTKPETLWAATIIFEDVVKEKIEKGYSENDPDKTPLSSFPSGLTNEQEFFQAKTTTGKKFQLLPLKSTAALLLPKQQGYKMVKPLKEDDFAELHTERRIKDYD
jgi:hypothetical protein